MVNSYPARHEFVILRNGSPYKLICLSSDQVTAYCRRLSARYPDVTWSVTDPFLPHATD